MDKKKMSFKNFEELFGRAAVQPDDALVVNDQAYVVNSVDAEGVEFAEVQDDDGDDEGDVE